MTAQRTIAIDYELPGGLTIVAEVELAEESGRVLRCYGPNGAALDADAIWIDTGDIDVGLLQLSWVLRQEARERAGVST